MLALLLHFAFERALAAARFRKVSCTLKAVALRNSCSRGRGLQPFLGAVSLCPEAWAELPRFEASEDEAVLCPDPNGRLQKSLQLKKFASGLRH